jgi:hypothetical protein
MIDNYNILSSFSLSSNFWETNEHLLLIKEFKEFHKRDKSRSKKDSSKIMWAISLLVHPKSKFNELSQEEKIKLISEEYLEESKAWIIEYSLLIDVYKHLVLTKLQRIALDWGNKLDERMRLIMSTPYTLDNAKELDEAMARTEKVWSYYQKCLADLETEESKAHVQGGAIESLSEQNKI